MAPVIAVDIGTTRARVAVWRGNRAEIIPSAWQVQATPPAIVSVDDASIKCAFDFKRILGRNFDDFEVQEDIKRFPFQVINKNGKPYVSAENKEFSPEELTAQVISNLMQSAKIRLGTDVQTSVITVPASFTAVQRQAVRNAAKIAGLEVIRVVKDYAAIATAYALETKSKQTEERRVLIVDMGGGYLSTALLTMEEGVCEVTAIAGDTSLCGADFNERLVKQFLEEFRRKNRKDLTMNPLAVRRLRSASERAKRELSTADSTDIELEALHEGVGFYTTLTRARFEELCADLFLSALEPINRLLKDTRLAKDVVDEVLLVGRATRMPRFAQTISDFLDGKPVVRRDEAVIHGAATISAILSGEGVFDILVIDAAAHSVGVEDSQGQMHVIMKRNTTCPTRKQDTVQIRCGGAVRVFEGERTRVEDNTYLGEIALNRCPSNCGQLHSVEVEVELGPGADLLDVGVEETGSGSQSGGTKVHRLRIPAASSGLQ